MYRVLLTVALTLALSPEIAHAEGSVDVNTGPDATMFRHILTMTTTALTPPYTVLRVYANAGERIEMGSSAMGLVPGQGDILVYPPGSSFGTIDGKIAPLAKDFPFATHIFDCNTDDATTGRGVLNTRAKELAGPGGSPGYTPCIFTAPTTGIYPVILFPVDPANVSSVPSGTLGAPNALASQKTYLSLWDVTVVKPDGTRAKGRVFTNHIGLRAYFNEVTPTPPGMANYHSYVLTTTGYLYDVTFFNHSGVNWGLLSDSRGLVVRATGKPLYASFNYKDPLTGEGHSEVAVSNGALADNATDPRYPIFFNPPDPVVISGPGGLGATEGIAAVPLSPSTTRPSGIQFVGEGPSGGPGRTTTGYGGTLSFSSPAALNGLSYDIGIDFDGDGSFDDPGDFVSRSNRLSDSGNVVHWDGKTGTGAIPSCATYQASANVPLSDVHFSQGDVENSGGMRVERLSLPSEPSLGDRLATNYNDLDPFKGLAVTNTSPAAALPGISGPGFHAWTGSTGDLDYIDTWNRLPALEAAGAAVVVDCPPPPESPPPQYDLSVRKTASALRVVVGSTFSYTLTVRNAGPDAAPADAIVADRVPELVEVLGVDIDRGTCGHSRNDVACNVGHLPAKADATVTIHARAMGIGTSSNITVVGITALPVIPPLTATPPPISYPAVPPSTAIDQLSNNVGGARVVVVAPSLTLSHSVSSRRAHRGETLRFSLHVRNISQSPVQNVLVCDRLASELRYTTSKPAAEPVANGRVRCWRIASLGAGKTREFAVHARAVRLAGLATSRAFAAAPLAQAAHASRRVLIGPRAGRPRFTG